MAGNYYGDYNQYNITTSATRQNECATRSTTPPPYDQCVKYNMHNVIHTYSFTPSPLPVPRFGPIQSPPV